MKKMISIIGTLLLIGCCAVPALSQEGPPKVRLETSLGVITLELNPQSAPKTVENFIKYVNDGFYDGTIFHRVIKGFMIQGGGFTDAMVQKPTLPAIQNEADNSLQNLRGTIAMARTAAPHSATAQFFINTVDNGFLNFKEKTGRGWGYCVFGKVTDGMDVVDAIEKQATTMKNGMGDVPVTPVVIKKAVMLNIPDATPAVTPAAKAPAETPPAK